MTNNAPDPRFTDDDFVVPDTPEELMSSEPDLSSHLAPLGDDPVQRDAIFDGSVGRTTFDQPGAEDGTVAALIHKDNLDNVPVQALVRITSRHDADDIRTHLGAVVAGPYYHPDGLRADDPMVITTAANRAMFMPPYHGWIQIEIIGEEAADQTIGPPRYRPRPNSPVHILDTDEKMRILKPDGTIRLGRQFGDPAIEVGIPDDDKNLLPRHTAAIGTTGSGKSTTVGNVVHEAIEHGWAVVMFDTEGEYVDLDKPTENEAIATALRRYDLDPEGVSDSAIFCLNGRDTANPEHPHIENFSPRFDRLSPWTIAEILDMNDAQQDRFFRTYDLAKDLLRQAGVYPQRGDETQELEAFEIDEFDTGYPHINLQLLIDLMRLTVGVVDKTITKKDELDRWNPRTAWLQNVEDVALRLIQASKPTSGPSWKKTLGMLGRLRRLGVFDAGDDLAINELLSPGRLSIVDLSDIDAPAVNNIVITDILRQIHRAQDDMYREWEEDPTGTPRKVLVVIEEAHEFISAERVKQMPLLLQQVSRIAKRGRKRWLGLMFVTQLPQHLPKEILALTNNQIIHKIADESVLRNLRAALPGIDGGLWKRIPTLAPGQAVVSIGHMRRPLLTTMQPARGKLRMVE